MYSTSMFELIAQDIKDQREKEVDNYANLKAIGLANVKINGIETPLWIFNKFNDRNLFREGIGQGFIENAGDRYFLSKGRPVSKNSITGEKIITLLHGKTEYEFNNRKLNLEIENSTFYTPHANDKEAVNITIHYGEKHPKRFESLTYILGDVHEKQLKVESIVEEIQEAEENQVDLTKIKALEQRLDQARKDQIEAQQKARQFIIRNAELRYQPILDPYQESIKRSNVFRNTIAIDGGPGTGKTTSLIQRINFLRDEAAIDDYMQSLTEKQKEKLRDPKRWIFFSPSELLMLFLQSSMIQEGLNASPEHVKVWNDHKQQLIKQYKFVDTEKQNPFLFLRKRSNELLLPRGANPLKKLLNSLESFIIEKEVEKFEKTIAINCDKFSWKITGLSIQNYLQREIDSITVSDLLRLYYNLENAYLNEVKEISTHYRNLLNQSAVTLLAIVQEQETLYTALKELINSWSNEQDDLEEDESENQLDDDSDEDIFDIDNKVVSKFKGLIRKLALIELNDSVKLTKRDKTLLEIFYEGNFEIAKNINLKEIGELSLFDKYFKRLVDGFDRNILNSIPRHYKLFRRNELKNRTNKWNFELLEFIVTNDQSRNKRIHPDEQALLLYFTNNIIKKCFGSFKRRTNESTHKYISAYKDYSKCIIGVDEATDFHLMDLLAIRSLEDFEVGSTTYSGDLMQRLTKNGLQEWGDLKKFMRDFEVKELKISYRQSPTLLKVAQDIYNTYNKSDREFESFALHDENEPKPLIKETDDEEAKIDWISKRIIEIYQAYGKNIPSIAIFLSDENDIKSFAYKLGEVDRLADVGIKVLACNNGQVLGDSNTVRVFSIEYIKGLEFEAVFYHNIHDLFLLKDTEMMMKNLYVGLSRASFYLGVTANPGLKELDFLRANSEFQNWK